MRLFVGAGLLVLLLVAAALFVLQQEPTAAPRSTTTTPTTTPKTTTTTPSEREAAPTRAPTTTPQQEARLTALLTRGAEELRASKTIYVLATAQEAVAVAPDDPRAWVLLGVAEYLRQQYTEAIEANQHALRLDPKYGDALYNLGCAFALTKRPDEAFQYLQRSALGDPARRAAFASDHDLDALHADPRWGNLIAP